jgi:hypothetical protein
MRVQSDTDRPTGSRGPRNGRCRSREAWSRRIGSGKAGQGSVEWVGLVALVAALFVALPFTGLSVPGTALVHSVSRSILCAASLSSDCFEEGSLEGEYGAEVAKLIRTNAPHLLFGPDLLGLPVDFRSCRSPACADAPVEGVVSESTAGEPVTLFTRVIDHRKSGGSLYLQYWAYYPESASLRGVPVLEDKGFHPHDWESTQVRIRPDGGVDQRASSHAGYNHTRSVANWGSDMGSGFLRRAAEELGLRERGGWGPARGTLLVASGSHAGNVDGPTDGDRYPTRTPARMVRLVPLEGIRGGPLVRPADFKPITPPWKKQVWRDPESDGTG